jgi:hypothetical protein
MVLHLDDDATDEDDTATHLDSSGNGNTGAQNGNVREDDGAGCIAGCQEFDGNNDHIDVPSAGLTTSGQALTIVARANATAEPNSFPHVFGTGNTVSYGSNEGRYWQLAWDSNANGYWNRLRTDDSYGENWTSSGDLDTWANLAVTYDGSHVRLYLDGTEIGNDPTTGDIRSLNLPFRIGANSGISNRQFEGLIDEIRVAHVARSAEWIEAEHLSQTDTLLSYGTIESLPVAVP